MMTVDAIRSVFDFSKNNQSQITRAAYESVIPNIARISADFMSRTSFIQNSFERLDAEFDFYEFLVAPKTDWHTDRVLKLYPTENLAEMEIKSIETLVVVHDHIHGKFFESFGFKVDEKYGPSLDFEAEEYFRFARPYSSAQNPNEGSEFSDLWETVVKTVLMYINVGLVKPNVKILLDHIRSIATNEWLSNGRDLLLSFAVIPRSYLWK